MFFSVKSYTKIAGKVYTPCVCYPLTAVIERTIQNLEKEGKANIYADRVFFQNGKVIEAKKEVKAEKKAAEQKAKEAKEAEEAEKSNEADEAEQAYEMNPEAMESNQAAPVLSVPGGVHISEEEFHRRWQEHLRSLIRPEDLDFDHICAEAARERW